MNEINNFQASREILWNINTTFNVVLMYCLFAVSLLLCGYGIYRRILLWSLGKPEKRKIKNLPSALVFFFKNIIGQKTVNRDKKVALFHAPIFYGFLVLLFTTTMVFLDHDLGIEIYRGHFYLAVTILSDLFGLFLILGVLKAYHRRYIQKPDRLHRQQGDLVMLGFLLVLCLQGFLLESLRIKATEDPWREYSFIGNLLSHLFWGLSVDSIKLLHYLTWWSHTLTVFAFIAYIPYSKFFHIFSSSVNLFFNDRGQPKGALRYPGDIEAIMEKAAESTEDDAFKIGVSTIKDLSWKQLLDLDACTSCGRCQEVCPAYNSGKPLSPKWLILDSRNHLLKLHAAEKFTPEGMIPALDKTDQFLLKNLMLDDNSDLQKANNPLVQNAALNIGLDPEHKLATEVLEENVFWSCTSCRACMEVCPVGIEHVDYIMDVRRSMALMEGTIPQEAQSSLRSIETRGNPFGPANERANWTEGLNVRILNEGDEADVLYWVGCVSSFDKRKQKIAKSLAAILNAAGIKWGILGNKECCTGDPARRLGEENLFQSSVKKNIDTLSKIKFKTLLTNCPHCFNSLKNEYSQISDLFEKNSVQIMHHAHYIQELIKNEKIKFNKVLDQDYTFHDPCYLGRYNDQYDQPRDVLISIGRKKPKEMKDSREKGMCCGAGGGHYWMDLKIGERVNVLRADQAAATNASIVATACPFCLQMLEDGVKTTNREEQMTVKDIAELVLESME